MFFNLFSNYLVSKGKLTTDDFATIKEVQAKTRVKLGLIAVSEKMITEKQADEINRKQAVMDKRFGDIAIDLGYLTSDQVSRLLELQGNPYMLFCQAITDSNIMTLAEVENQFDEFIKENGFDADAANAIKSDDIDKIVPLYLPGADDKMIDLISVAIRTMNRLISTDLCIKEGKKVPIYNYNYIASQSLEGDYRTVLGISGGEEGVLEIASIFAQEEFDTVELDSLDAVGEFINIVNGLYATALSYNKIQVELMPPFYEDSVMGDMTGDNLYVVPLEVNQKPFELIVKFQ